MLTNRRPIHPSCAVGSAQTPPDDSKCSNDMPCSMHDGWLCLRAAISDYLEHSDGWLRKAPVLKPSVPQVCAVMKRERPLGMRAAIQNGSRRNLIGKRFNRLSKASRLRASPPHLALRGRMHPTFEEANACRIHCIGRRWRNWLGFQLRSEPQGWQKYNQAECCFNDSTRFHRTSHLTTSTSMVKKLSSTHPMMMVNHNATTLWSSPSSSNSSDGRVHL